MTVLHCYTSTYNDLYMIRHYVRHWSRYASKIFVYDDDSTDGTREFLESCASLVEVKSPGFHGIDEILLQELRSNEYKKYSRGIADWVAITDADEFHYHVNMLEALEDKKCKGYCAIVSQGYQMFAATPPAADARLTDEVREGIIDSNYNRVIFNPELSVVIGIGHHGFMIEDGPILRFTRHNPMLTPKGTEEQMRQYPIESADQRFKMLHYKYLGYDYVKERHARYWPRLSQRNRLHEWGHHSAPDWTGGYSAEWYLAKLNQRRKVID